MSNKVLTLVVPTYNMEKYLDRCLTSLIVFDSELISQLEVLVVIDGATDRSSEIAHKYESRYPAVFRVIEKENGNYGSCINRGLKEAAGKYIKILDADDWFDTTIFENFLNLLRSLDVDVVLNNMVRIDPSGIIKYKTDFPLAQNLISTLSEFVLQEDKEMWMHCVCYKTQKVQSIAYLQTEGISYTDQEWIFLPMANCHSIYYFSQVLYNYLIGRDGQTISNKTWNRNFWQELKGMRVMLEEYSDNYSSLPIESQKYLRWRIHERLHIIYSAYLLWFRTLINPNHKLMSDFDHFLESNYHEFWIDADILLVYGSPHFCYHPIRDWRKSYRRQLYKVIYIDGFNLFRAKIHTLRVKLGC